MTTLLTGPYAIRMVVPVVHGESPKPMKPGQVADLFNVSIQTVAKWADDGLLPSFRTPGGQRRFRREDVEEFLTSQRPEVASA